jgi:glycosyltransferase involved in cell wall biosynthesis
MNELNTIIIPTKNNQDCINRSLNQLKEYIDKHPSTSAIIISDNASNDETLPQIVHWIHQNKDSRFLLITQPKSIPEKKCLLVALEQVQTPISIIIEPQLYTRLHQIKKQIELLRKCNFVLPSRLHKDSRTNYQPDFKKKISIIFNKKRYDDLENQNKAFHTKIIMNLLKKTKTENYWEEIINNQKIRITQTSTHWVKE